MISKMIRKVKSIEYYLASINDSDSQYIKVSKSCFQNVVHVNESWRIMTINKLEAYDKKSNHY